MNRQEKKLIKLTEIFQDRHDAIFEEFGDLTIDDPLDTLDYLFETKVATPSVSSTFSTLVHLPK